MLTSRPDEQAQMLINLSDTKTNIQLAQQSTLIADQSKLIAERTQKDSTAMVTMAVLTHFFLPGTFLAALFSTIFFDLNSNKYGLIVHEELWIYVVTAFILTILVMVLWVLWYKGVLTSIIGKFKTKGRPRPKEDTTLSG